MFPALALWIAVAANARAEFVDSAALSGLSDFQRAARTIQTNIGMENVSRRPALEAAPHLILWRGQATSSFISPVYNVESFDRAVMSWNANGPAVFELGVNGQWFVMGRWGEEPESVRAQQVDIDTLKLDAPASAIQFRITPEPGTVVTLAGVTFWRAGDRGELSNDRSAAWGLPPIDVPQRSQFNERTCSPTSLSMVLQYYGFNKPTEEVARGVYDRAADAYGNWSFNVAYAHQVGGFETYVRRMIRWKDVEEEIDAGHPVIISVKGPPLFSNEGHLIVVVGFDRNGDVIVNDPAHRGQVRKVYDRAELFKAWMVQASGVAYILHGPSR